MFGEMILSYYLRCQNFPVIVTDHEKGEENEGPGNVAGRMEAIDVVV